MYSCSNNSKDSRWIPCSGLFSRAYRGSSSNALRAASARRACLRLCFSSNSSSAILLAITRSVMDNLEGWAKRGTADPRRLRSLR